MTGSQLGEIVLNRVRMRWNRVQTFQTTTLWAAAPAHDGAAARPRNITASYVRTCCILGVFLSTFPHPAMDTKTDATERGFAAEGFLGSYEIHTCHFTPRARGFPAHPIPPEMGSRTATCDHSRQFHAATTRHLEYLTRFKLPGWRTGPNNHTIAARNHYATLLVAISPDFGSFRDI